MTLEGRIGYLHGTCLRKKVYRSLEFAKERAKYYQEKYGKPYYVYLCPVCLNYHLTTHKHVGAKYY